MRFVPRFSLRFVLLALTVFLIVFGVGVMHWREYQLHERLAKLFDRNGIHVEEEPITLAGIFLGKSMTGLLVESDYAEISDLELLRQIPRPRDVRRLSFVGGEKLKHHLQEILDTIALFPNLEALELSGFVITQEHFEHLKQFQQLEYLSLARCQLRSYGNNLFTGMKSLKTLRLRDLEQVLDVQKFLKNDLPELEYLEISEGNCEGTIDLTKAGFGRFPQLQYLTLNRIGYYQIKCEDDALPQLRYLDISSLPAESKIPWQELVRLAPNLEALTIKVHHLDKESITALAKWKRLAHLECEYYRIFVQYDNSENPLVRLPTAHGDKVINQSKLPIATVLVQQCPHLQWHSPYRWDWDDWKLDFFRPGRSIHDKFMRESENWRPRQ